MVEDAGVGIPLLLTVFRTTFTLLEVGRLAMGLYIHVVQGLAGFGDSKQFYSLPEKLHINADVQASTRPKVQRSTIIRPATE